MSKTTKILDLDKFGDQVDRTITIKGIEYPVTEMTFENFVATTKEAQELNDNPSATTVEHMEASIRMIVRTIPTLPVEVLRSLGLEKIATINKFINGELDEQVEKAAAGAIEGEGAEAKK